jgi:hypothetical protein
MSFLCDPFKVKSWSQVWWFISVIPALGMLRSEDHAFVDSLGYIVRPCLKPNQTRVKSFGDLFQRE